MNTKLIKLLRQCKHDSAWGIAIKENIKANPDQLIESLRSQAIDSPNSMARIVGIHATELLLGRALTVVFADKEEPASKWKRVPVVRKSRIKSS